jgi:hypothetical protein
MKKMKMILLASALLFLSACSVKEHRVLCDSVDGVKLELPDPRPVKLNRVNFFVITEQNAEQLFDALKDSGHKPVFYGLTLDGYRSLSLNVEELRRYILESNFVLEEYRKYYESK